MTRRITIIQGHPDRSGKHYCHALAASYAKAAEESGHSVRTLSVASMEFPLLRSAQEWEGGSPSAVIQEAQKTIAWAEHLLIVFPLWLGDMPALLKAFFEQALRPGFAIGKAGHDTMPPKLLKGRSARIVVTMGMPAFFYRLYYRAHSVKSLKRNILGFCGFVPVRTTLIGMVTSENGKDREQWLGKLARYGREGS